MRRKLAVTLVLSALALAVPLEVGADGSSDPYDPPGGAFSGGFEHALADSYLFLVQHTGYVVWSMI